MHSPHASDTPRGSNTVEKEHHAVEEQRISECPPSVNDKALVRRIDRKVLPMLFIVYVAAFLDRVNISNALTMNLPKDLHLKGNQPNIALTIFFVPYVLFEIPSNMLLKKFKPHVWLSACIFTFGIFMLAQGFVQSYGALLATRFFLGLAEAGIFPGSFYLISFWYSREESQKRFTFYWCSVLIASAFGGLLASAIANMNGVAGLSNWRWIFILEGIATILIGVAAYFLLSDFPEQAKWITEDERKWIIKKTGRYGEPVAPITAEDVLTFFKDPKNILGGIIYFSIVVPIYSFAYFAPTIIKGLGYSVVETQLHTVPPVAASLVLAILLAYFSDRTKHRSSYLALCFCITIAGLATLLKVHHHFSVQYMGIHFATLGGFAGGPIFVCWYVMNLRGHAERAIGTAWVIGFGNIGGIMATFSFLSTDAPLYKKGYSAVLAVTAIGAVAACIYAFEIWRLNKKTASAERGKKGWRYSL